MAIHPKDATIQRCACAIIANLSTEKENAQQLSKPHKSKNDACKQLLCCMRNFENSQVHQEQAMKALSNILVWNKHETVIAKLQTQGAWSVIDKAQQKYPKSSTIIKTGDKIKQALN